jgi:four helix bundle protein
MDNKEFSKKLEERTKEFAISVIRLSVKLPNTTEGKVIRNQFTKAGTSVGANYREANRARSRADFSNKIKICESETSETLYWIEIITELNWVEVKDAKPIIIEAKEFLAIFSSIGKTLKH